MQLLMSANNDLESMVHPLRIENRLNKVAHWDVVERQSPHELVEEDHSLLIRRERRCIRADCLCLQSSKL